MSSVRSASRGGPVLAPALELAAPAFAGLFGHELEVELSNVGLR